MKRLGKSLEDDEAFQSVEILDDQPQPQQQQPQPQQQRRQQTYEPSNLNRGAVGAVGLSVPLAQQGEGQEEGVWQEEGKWDGYDSDSDTILRKLSGGVPAEVGGAPSAARVCPLCLLTSCNANCM
jgi:hypothetical protein